MTKNAKQAFKNLCNHYSASEHVGLQIAIAKSNGINTWTKAGAIWGRSTATHAQQLVKQGVSDMSSYISAVELQWDEIAWIAESFWRKFHRAYTMQ